MEGKPRSGNIQDSIYVSLRKNIINLNLAPGTGISEKEVALRYRVSRTPVREAFIHLAKEGLVRVVPQKETLVSLIDLARVEQECFIRRSLEMAVLDPFIGKSTAEHLDTMERLIEKQNAAAAAGDIINFVDRDDDFHRIFFEAADQLLSWDTLQSTSSHYRRVRLLTIRLKGIAGGVIGEHRELLESLKKKNAARARKLLMEHINKLNAEEDLLKKEFPPYFAAEDADVFNVVWNDGVHAQSPV
ncbi:MAG: GntR family transcriptional regulator [Treponema sp.]|jgi:DNA-binding GntR family transcriptional regulator|nr:GntR family transcriptional regulator [Treponema sp.]